MSTDHSTSLMLLLFPELDGVGEGMGEEITI